jgi:hypothetical protein
VQIAEGEGCFGDLEWVSETDRFELGLEEGGIENQDDKMFRREPSGMDTGCEMAQRHTAGRLDESWGDD